MSYSSGYFRLASGYSSVSLPSPWYVKIKYLKELSIVTTASAPAAIPTTQSWNGLQAYWFWHPRIRTSFPDLFSKSIEIGLVLLSVRQSTFELEGIAAASCGAEGGLMSYSSGYFRLASGYSSVSLPSPWYVNIKYMKDLSIVTIAVASAAMPTTQSWNGLQAYWF